MEHIWGIDLGGTKIEGIVILLEKKDPEVISRIRIPTQLEGGYDHVLQRITDLIGSLKTESGLEPKAIGFGTPGTIDTRTDTLKNSNSVIYNGKPLHKDLEKKLGVQVKMENDANCFAMAETHFGVVKQFDRIPRTVFGVILGTGVGGGIVIDGQVLHGKHGIGGEWGHNFLDESGGPCYCGRSGCVETIISGTALEKYYTSLTGRRLSLKEINKLAEKDDLNAEKTLSRLHMFFGRAMAMVINIIDPDVIILGGGVGNISSLYTAGKNEIEKHIFNPYLDTPILQPVLGDSAGVFGAAALVL